MIFSILLIAAPIITLVICIYKAIDEDEGVLVIVGFFGGMLADLLIILIMLFPCFYIDNGEFVYHRNSIYSISENVQNVTQGSFFLGSGYVSGEPYYFVFLENNGVKTIKKIKMDGLIVEESSKDKPYYEIGIKRNKPSFWLPKWWLTVQDTTEKIVIPPNSIIVNFELR